jgi:hypothetical protein
VVVVGAVVLLAACSDSPTAPAVVTDPDPDKDGFLSADDLCPNQPETINNVFDGDGCPDSPADLYGFVRSDVETYWGSVLPEQLLTYSPIAVFAPYTAPVDTPCGPIPINNAVYCFLNAGVYYHAPFMQELLDSIGDAAPAFVIAHELGHHIGTGHLGWFGGITLTKKQSELGADCLGGAWLASADHRGMLEEGDAEELIETMFAIADPDYTWFDPNEHGTFQQRLTALATGVQGGPWACLPPPGSIGGWVFADVNANGFWDSSEGVWQNAPVRITDHWERTSTVYTDQNGRWTATNLPIGLAIADIDEAAFPAGVFRTFGTDPDTVLVVTGGLTEAGYDGFHQQAAADLVHEGASIAINLTASGGHR